MNRNKLKYVSVFTHTHPTVLTSVFLNNLTLLQKREKETREILTYTHTHVCRAVTCVVIFLNKHHYIDIGLSVYFPRPLILRPWPIVRMAGWVRLSRRMQIIIRLVHTRTMFFLYIYQSVVIPYAFITRPSRSSPFQNYVISCSLFFCSILAHFDFFSLFFPADLILKIDYRRLIRSSFLFPSCIQRLNIIKIIIIKDIVSRQ